MLVTCKVSLPPGQFQKFQSPHTKSRVSSPESGVG